MGYRICLLLYGTNREPSESGLWVGIRSRSYFWNMTPNLQLFMKKKKRKEKKEFSLLKTSNTKCFVNTHSFLNKLRFHPVSKQFHGLHSWRALLTDGPWYFLLVYEKLSHMLFHRQKIEFAFGIENKFLLRHSFPILQSKHCWNSSYPLCLDHLYFFNGFLGQRRKEQWWSLFHCNQRTFQGRVKLWAHRFW